MDTVLDIEKKLIKTSQMFLDHYQRDLDRLELVDRDELSGQWIKNYDSEVNRCRSEIKKINTRLAKFKSESRFLEIK